MLLTSVFMVFLYGVTNYIQSNNNMELHQGQLPSFIIQLSIEKFYISAIFLLFNISHNYEYKIFLNSPCHNALINKSCKLLIFISVKLKRSRYVSFCN